MTAKKRAPGREVAVADEKPMKVASTRIDKAQVKDLALAEPMGVTSPSVVLVAPDSSTVTVTDLQDFYAKVYTLGYTCQSGSVHSNYLILKGVTPVENDPNAVLRLSDITNSASAARVALGAAFVTPTAADAAYAKLGATAPSAKLPPRRTVTKIVDFGTAGHGWTASSAAASSNMNDSSNFGRGAQSASVVTKGDGQVVPIRNTALAAMNLTGRRFEVSLMVPDWTHVRALSLYVGDTGFASFRIISLWDKNSVNVPPAAAGEWFTLTADLSSVSSTTGTPAIGAVTAMQVAVQDDAAGAATMYANHIGHFPAATPGYPNGVVSFSFDDGFASQKTVAAPYLERYNFQGTFYAIVSLLGTDPYYMTTPQLQNMQYVGGHEIAAHAYTLAAHNAVGGFTALSPSTLDLELRSLKNWLTTNGFRGRDHLAYPQGLWTPAVETAARSYFASSRVTIKLPMEGPNPANVMRLRNGFSLSTPYTLAQAKAAVDLAYANGSWLIFVTHDLVTTPPTPAGTTFVQWDIASFQQIVDYVASKGIPVRTVGDVLATVT